MYGHGGWIETMFYWIRACANAKQRCFVKGCARLSAEFWYWIVFNSLVQGIISGYLTYRPGLVFNAGVPKLKLSEPLTCSAVNCFFSFRIANLMGSSRGIRSFLLIMLQEDLNVNLVECHSTVFVMSLWRTTWHTKIHYDMLPNKLPHDVMTYHINITLISGFKNSGHWEKKCDELLTRFNRVKNQKSNKLSFCLVAKKKKGKNLILSMVMERSIHKQKNLYLICSTNFSREQVCAIWYEEKKNSRLTLCTESDVQPSRRTLIYIEHVSN